MAACLGVGARVSDDPATDCAALQAVLNPPRTPVLGRAVCVPCGPLRTASDAARPAAGILSDSDDVVEVTVGSHGEDGHDGCKTADVHLGVAAFA